MRYLLVLALLFVVASCGKKSKNKAAPTKERETVCSGAAGALVSEEACGESFDWSIESSSVNFPKNYSLAIDGVTYFNTCKNKSRVAKVTTEGDKTYIRFENFRNLIKEELSIKIIDKGALCDNDAIFFNDANVEYKMEKLSSKKYLIVVKLNN